MCIQRASSEKASANAEADPSRSEAASESAAPIFDFDAYLNSLHSTVDAEASATATVKSDVTAFAEALVDVEFCGSATRSLFLVYRKVGSQVGLVGEDRS